MENNIDNLKVLLNKIRTVGFFERLFSWHRVKNLAIDAIADLERFVTNNGNTVSKLAEVTAEFSNQSKDFDVVKSENDRLSGEAEVLRSNLARECEERSALKATLSSKETLVESNIQEIARIESDVKLLRLENDRLVAQNLGNSEELSALRQSNSDLVERRNGLEVELEGVTQELSFVRQERNTLKDQVTEFVTEQDNRRTAHDASVDNLREIKEQLQKERADETAQRAQLELERLRKLKDTWSLHQDNVKSAMKVLCNKLAVEYVPHVPFKGSPDNTIKICDEYIIFDAKSPAGDDLGNFPTHLKSQAENAKKYAKLENVKSTVYFVVPTNTLDSLKQYVYDLADYQVQVISFDSLEQVMMSLKKIEEYEFIDFLSPEERDAVCRIVGKYVHMTKRRIQVDHYFLQHSIDLVFKAHNDLPPEFLLDVMKYEKAEKMNPPTEKRSKVIDMAELDEKVRGVSAEIGARGLLAQMESVPEDFLPEGLAEHQDAPEGGQAQLFVAA